MMIQRPRVRASATAVAVLAALSFAVPAFADQLAGQVSAVDPVAKSVVVTETESGKDVTVSIPDQAPIVTTTGARLVLKDLKAGDGVGIAHTAGVATKVLVNVKPPGLLGQLSSVDTDAKTLVVTQAGTDKDITVTLGARTPIMSSAGQPVRLQDLKQGDGIALTYAGKAVARVVVTVKPEELDGHVQSVAPDLKSFVVKETGTDKIISVVVNGKTAIATTAGKRIELKELKKGDGVGVAHRASVASKIVVNVKPVE